MELVQPSAEYKDSFIEAVKEFQADADYTHRNKWYWALSIPELEKDFDAFIEGERCARLGNLPAKYDVPRDIPHPVRLSKSTAVFWKIRFPIRKWDMTLFAIG